MEGVGSTDLVKASGGEDDVHGEARILSSMVSSPASMLLKTVSIFRG